ncbi:50S ribosomal protein L18 [Pseudobdellovibrio exovorus]|uniref:Large ribosomal subunit protein uL18 n=1 Tax=Pseudobdellovibrio exovorus JSS TaxID=1184267 RepID=M4V9P0_9BACT|nr:50S ribosomal protein L18 [Pseudobdellovibrio exovorus]AGH96112.1 50S ribosomal protein L18 [Pseudobdellovibrio exovorus JSS]
MKLRVSKHTSSKTANRMKKKIRIRKTVKGTSERPRLCVFRSGKHIYAQVINDDAMQTILAVSSLSLEAKASGKDLAKTVGKAVAEAAIKKGINTVVFDRNGFIYHGRIQSLADGAREAGLQF